MSTKSIPAKSIPARTIPAGSKPDVDDPEWTDATFARARRPGEVLPPEVLPPEVLAAFPRTRGPQKEPTKVAVSIRLDARVVEHFKSAGPGWQSRINDALKKVAGV